MMTLVYPKEYALDLSSAMHGYHLCKSGWKDLKTVYVVRGMLGCGKTSFILNHFKETEYFYFSFAGLGEEIAEKLFAEKTSKKLSVVVSGWEDSIKAIAKKYEHVVLDDLTSVYSYKRFHQACYDHMITDINKRPFVILIAQTADNISGLADNYATLNLDYLTIRNVTKIFPKTPKPDVLGIYTLSGGIPKILREYDEAKSFEDNLRSMILPSSAFFNHMPELLARCFRKPENYHYILCAIANGNHNVSGIGKYTGFAYNKCDNYLAGLIDNKFVCTVKTITKRGVKRTAYKLTNSYFRVWYLYIYGNKTELQLGNEAVINGIIQDIVKKEIHRIHLEKALEYTNKQIRGNDMSVNFGIRTKITHAPYVINTDDFRYTFDAIARNGNKAVFVKVLEDPSDGCGRETLEAIRNAVALANAYYDSRVFIFTKRRVSDYAVKEASTDDTISLVRVEQLR